MMVTQVAESKSNSNKLSEKIWGHRFTDGQRGIEYVLEFLNVMAGANYKLDATHYFRKKMELFRKFVFEGEKHGAAKKGESSFLEFSNENKEKLMKDLGIQKNDLEDLQLFFKNLRVELLKAEGKPMDRSWYAQMLFPLNEALLFFELRARKNNNDEISAYERNFFARGGELYYLMITYGTSHDSELRKSIEESLKKLMSGNQNIGRIVQSICDSLNDDASFDYNQPLSKAVLLQNKKELLEQFEGAAQSEYPTLPNKNKPIFKIMAEDLNALLKIEVDIYEFMGVFTSLVNFHIYSYMMTQASDYIDIKYKLFIDCMDGSNPHIKRLAQHTYKENERIVKECFDRHTDFHLEKLLPKNEAEEKIKEWKDEAQNSTAKTKVEKYKNFFKELKYSKLHEKAKNELIDTLVDDNKQAYRLLVQKIKEISRKDLTEQCSILNILSRDGGFMTSGRGVQARYTMSDNLLSAFVYVLLDNEELMPFKDFKRKLFERYHIVIAEDEATISGIYEAERINLRCFIENGTHLRTKLAKNGLLEEYSDATAFIKNPYFNRAGV